MASRTDEGPRRALLCVLANPPLRSGKRTLARLELARELLGFETVRVGNLFALPSTDVTEISRLGAGPEGWVTAREQLAPAITDCDGALLAYGVSEPTGPAREHHRRQLIWLSERITATGRRVFKVGDGPRHPSRWQRWTAREHPDLDFPQALKVSLATWSTSVPWGFNYFSTPRPTGHDTPVPPSPQ